MIHHMCIDVRGMLRWPTREAKRMLRIIKRSDGTPFASVEEFRDAMMEELANGHEVLAMTDPPCEGFDFKTGCPGHKEELATATAA